MSHTTERRTRQVIDTPRFSYVQLTLCAAGAFIVMCEKQIHLFNDAGHPGSNTTLGSKNIAATAAFYSGAFCPRMHGRVVPN